MSAGATRDQTSPGRYGPRPMHPPSPRTINLLLALLCLLWGSTWIVIREGLNDLPPFTSAGVRFALAGLVMVALALTIGRRESGNKPPTYMWVMHGTLNFAVSYGIVYCTETVLPSGLVAVLWGVYPMMMAACGHFFLPGERLAARQWAGFFVGFAGLLLLFLTDLQNFGSVGIPAAAILLISPLVSVIGTTVVKKHGANTNSTLLNRNGMLLGAVLLLLCSLIFERDAEMNWSNAALLGIGYLALGGTVLTFGIYFWLLRYAPAYKLSLIAYVTPAIALFLGWIIDNEPVTIYTVSGSVLIMGGILGVVRGK